MTDNTAFPYRLMLVDEWSALRRVTLKTGVVSAEKCEPAPMNRLLHICCSAFYGRTDMWIVAIGTTHFAFEDRVAVRQLELRPHVEVTLKTGLG
jgi:hypothetical protein